MNIKSMPVLKENRKKYGGMEDYKKEDCRPHKCRRRSLERNLLCSLSILHDSCRNEDWARKIKGRIFDVRYY
jgi:hypothetical protein